jgi:hypothetical protein
MTTLRRHILQRIVRPFRLASVFRDPCILWRVCMGSGHIGRPTSHRWAYEWDITRAGGSQ